MSIRESRGAEDLAVFWIDQHPCAVGGEDEIFLLVVDRKGTEKGSALDLPFPSGDGKDFTGSGEALEPDADFGKQEHEAMLPEPAVGL